MINKSTWSVQSSTKVNAVLIWSRDLDPNFSGTFLSKDTSVIKFSWRSDSFFSRDTR